MNPIFRTLQEARRHLRPDLTIEQIAMHLGLSQEEVQEWECGKPTHYDHIMLAYCILLEVGFPDLVILFACQEDYGGRQPLHVIANQMRTMMAYGLPVPPHMIEAHAQD